MDKLLITGGQGFIGAWIARSLLSEGTPFTVVDLRPDDFILRQVLEPEELSKLDRIFGDVSDPEFVARAVKESEARLIIHLAGLQVPTCRETPVLGARVNVIGTLNVFEAARGLGDQVKAITFASSAAVAGPAEDYSRRISDDARHLPRTHYGVFKTANEGNARIYWQDHGIPSVGLRPLSVYGVGREVGVTSGPTKAIRAAVLGEEYTIPFSGVTGFNFAADVAADFIACARQHREGAVALNNPGENHDVAEFIALIEELVPDARGKIHSEGGPIPVAYDFDEAGLESIIGKVPHTPIRDGIAQTVDRFRLLEKRGILGG